MSCGVCGKVRSHMPEAIRKRLEDVERRIQAKKAEAKPPSVSPMNPPPKLP